MELATSQLELDISYESKVSFASYQNYVPLVRRVTLHNRSDHDLEQLTLALWAEPGIAVRDEYRVGRLPAGGSCHIDRVDIWVSYDRLADQNDVQRGELCAEVLAGGKRILEKQLPLEVLPYNHWSGGSTLPEILAAFVLPKHPAIKDLLVGAERTLASETEDGSLAAYLTRDESRVRRVAEAIYDRLRELEIRLVSPPGTYEHEGQRIRTPEQITAGKMATCLDLTTMFAACLEKAGLEPIVLMQSDHAMVGLWLEPGLVSRPVISECAKILTRVDAGVLLVIEVTAATSDSGQGDSGEGSAQGSSGRGFAEACRLGEDEIKKADKFLFAVDIARAREVRIRPLPIRIAREDLALVESDSDTEPQASDEPAQPDTPEEPAPDTARLEVWKQKLLDLSLRNRLLNFRHTKKTLPLECKELEALEDALADERTFTFVTAPDGEEPASWLESGQLRVALEKDALDQQLVQIYRAYRSSLEQNGANTLFLALGFLEWYETSSATVARKAPILLLPVELERKSVRTGFRLRLSEEDIRINDTLLQKLSVDYGIDTSGLSELPADDSGLDVAKVFERLRTAIQPEPRWRVLDEACLGLFSFTKFLMWLDLERHSTMLQRNPVVEHLTEHADTPFEPDGNADPIWERKANEMFCLADADSSQLAAMFSAIDGKSFVLEGPPGTGKSQTITNLITQGLAEGKRILFVSAKMAALDVVYKRLKALGQAPFCLELHSNKTSKKHVLEQLDEALSLEPSSPSDAWSLKALQLETTKTELDEYCRALHEQREAGFSGFRAIAQLGDHREVHIVDLDLGDHHDMDRNRRAALTSHVESLEVATRDIDSIPEHPFLQSRLTEWDRSVTQKLSDEAKEFVQVGQGLERLGTSLAELFGLEYRDFSLSFLELLAELAQELIAGASPTKKLIGQPLWGQHRQRLHEWIEHGRRRDRLRQEVFGKYRPEILELELEDLRDRLAESVQSTWPVSWWRFRQVKKAMSAVMHGDTLPPHHELSKQIDLAIELRKEMRFIAEGSAEAGSFYGDLWNDGSPKWDDLKTLTEWVDRFRLKLAKLAHYLPEGGDRVLLLAVDGPTRDEAMSPLETGTSRLVDLIGQWKRGIANTTQLLQLTHDAYGDHETDGYVRRVIERVEGFLEHIGELRQWTGYVRARKTVMDEGLDPLVLALEQGTITPAELKGCFRASFLTWWLDGLLEEEQSLRRFTSAEHEHRIALFRALDEDLIRLARGLVCARLQDRLPQSQAWVEASDQSEVGILKREIKKSRAHMPIRKLLRKIPHLLPRLKPCMLMSPLSVVQYLDPDCEPFDIVVFDEASQIPVWDAIGAMGRGKTVVVVGDSQQLPPTTFFQRMTDQDDEAQADDDTIQELESILDECVAAGLPTRRLSWHYRSRHESLIAFSNYHYYQNSLLTFPDAGQNGEMGVHWRFCEDGIYDRARSATNRREAEAVVAEIVDRARSGSKLSIGVVTFNRSQQELLLDLLEHKRREDQEFDAWLSADVDEPLFVKNLENVQGDERDVILFSICYGKDPSGRLFMNFGPLNHQGGHRRLNVAITRAREQVHVFSSLLPEQIDLSRVSTNALGVYHLRTFLEYAQTGTAAISEATTPFRLEDWESPFERDIHQTLVDEGWLVQARVGCSDYRIDLGVRDPANPERFLLGIETDGTTYASAKTARDRDRIRHKVLVGLGWNLHRVWSTDWLYERDRQLAKLRAALEAAADTANRVEPEVPLDGTDGDDAAISNREPSAPIATPPTSRSYVRSTNEEVEGDSEEFYSQNNNERVIAGIQEIVDTEAPVELSLVLRRLSPRWQLSRITSKVRTRVKTLLQHVDALLCTHEDRLFLWRRDEDPEAYEGYRTSTGDAERESSEIPPIEIANAACAILEINISLSIEDLVRETARLFGFSRAGTRVDADFRDGIRLLFELGRAREDGARVILA